MWGLYVSAEIVDALASAGTLVVAIFVFLEARPFRKADAIFRQNQMWNDFGNKIAELHEGSRIGEVLMGKKGISGKDLTAREAFLLMSFFNVVSSEYNAYRAKAIDRQYVVHSLSMTSKIVKNNKDWIFSFLLHYGYELSFRRIVAIVALTSDEAQKRRTVLRRELVAMSVWGTICGPKFRTWLRKHLNESQVEALCEGNAEGIDVPA